MPPRHELNERFQGHIRRAQRTRTASTAFLATLTVLAVVGSAAFAFQDIAPNMFARATATPKHLASQFAAASREGITAAFAPLRAIPATAHQQLAAASSFPWLDTAGKTLFNILCPIFRDCPEKPQLPEKQKTQHATKAENVKQPNPIPQATPGVATTSARVVSGISCSPASPAPPTVINQPIVERIREVQTAGVNAAYVDARIMALSVSMQRQFDAMANANATSFRSVSSSGGSSPPSIAASIITGTITNAIDSVVGEFLDLTTNTLVATNATTTTLYVSATSTTVGLRVASLDCSSLGNGGTLTTDASGNVVCAADDGGSGSVGGSDTQVQFNDGGSLGADSGLTFNKTADRLTTVNASTTNLSASYASTTALVAGTSILGTVSSGTWQGTAIGDSFLTKTGDWTGTLDGYEASTLLSSAFSTTSADVWKSQRNFFATTSADYWETQQTARTADDLTNNSIEDLSDVAAISETYGDLFAWNGSAWADFATSSLAIALSDTTGTLGATRGGTGLSSITAAGILLGNYAGTGWQQLATSTLGLLTTHVAEGSNQYYTDVRVQTYLDGVSKGFFFSTTSASYFLAQNQGAGFSTTSATYFADASTTIPKTYSANTFTALQTFGNASTTNLSASYASSTQGFFGSLSIGSLTGFLKATAGSIATALINLASDVTGILPVANGGTGWGNLASGALVLGNGTGAVATTSAGTDGQVLALVGGIPSWVATSTLSTISGTLGVSKGGTGLTSFTLGDVLYASGATTLAGTSTANLKTTLALNNVENTALSTWAGSSNLTTLGTLGSLTVSGNSTLSHSTTTSLYVNSSLSASSAAFGGTATSSFSTSGALTLGSALTLSGTPNGPLHANAGVVGATTSIGVLYGGTGLTSAPTYGQVLVGNSSGGYTLTATSSLGISGGSSLFTDGGNTTYLTSSDVLGVGTTTAWSKLAVYGDLFVEGSSRYLNFGTATGTNGYGFRDNAGTLEFKNSGGSWQGVTTATSGPSFNVYKDANETVTTSTYLKLTWPVEVFDTNNNFASDRFTPTVPGKYIVTVTVYCTDSTSHCFALIFKNGTRVYAAANRTNADQSATITGIVDMNGSTDYVEGWGYNGGGTTIQGDANQRLTTFSGALIAPVSATAGGWQNDGTQSFLADSTDKVGIGTSTPWASLSVHAAAGTNSFAVGSSTATYFLVNSSGNVGIGTTAPSQTLSVAGSGSFTGDLLIGTHTGAKLTVTGNDGGSGFRVTGSNNHWNSMYPDASGNIYFQSDTSYCTLAASGTSWSCPSDARLKQNVEPLEAGSGLAAVMLLRPISFDLISDATHAPQIGFMAQDVQQIFPQLVWRSSATSTFTPDGTLVLSQTGLIAPMVKAIQDLNLKLEDLATTTATTTDQSSFTSRFVASLFTRLTQWFADATNGITDLFAKIGHFDEVCAKNSDGTETCVDGDQLKSLLGASAAGASDPGRADEAPSGSSAPSQEGADTVSTTTPSATTTPPSEDIANEEPADAPALGAGVEASADAAPELTDAAADATTPTPEAANDNSPTESLPATGSE